MMASLRSGEGMREAERNVGCLGYLRGSRMV